MQKDDKNKIEVLQRRKMIYAVEAVAVNTSVLIGIILVEKYIQLQSVKNTLIILGGLFGIGFALYACIGNLFRYKEIKRLSKKLI